MLVGSLNNSRYGGKHIYENQKKPLDNIFSLITNKIIERFYINKVNGIRIMNDE